MNLPEYQTMYELEDTHWWYVGLRRLLFQMLGRDLTGRGTVRILDAGCGTGGTLRSLQNYGDVCGVDTSPVALGLSRKRGVRRLVQASVTSLPFRDGSFDIVVSNDVVCTLPVGGDSGALREFRRMIYLRYYRKYKTIKEAWEGYNLSFSSKLKH